MASVFKLSIIGLGMALSMAAQAGTVTVLTSFPKELTEAYKKAFEKKYPDIRLEILNKNHTAALAYLKELPAGQRPDVFWASAPDAFEVLSRDKLLSSVADLRNAAVPEKVGNYPINDPEGLYLGQALSGYGIMWNKRYLQAHKLPEPHEWADLTKPAYFGHVAMSSPSRSGTTHLTVETILQGEGWEKGWNQLLEIAGNCAAVTERSFGTPDGVNNGQFGVGLVIDFFGLAGKAAGFPVDFVYPAITSVVPASIGVIEGGKNSPEARKFVQYALSIDGQQVLFDPKVSRMPVLPYSGAGLKVPAGYPNIYEVARKSKVQFDSALSEERYHVVISMFDQMVTFRLKELQAATKAIHEAEAALQAKPNAQGTELVKQARSLAYTPLVSEKNIMTHGFTQLFRKNKKDAEVAQKMTGLEELWNSKAMSNYLKARQLAEQAATLAK